MNDELFRIITTILGTVMTIGVGILVRSNGKIGDNQQAQAVDIAEMKGTLSGIVGSVNKLQERAFEDMATQIATLRQQLKDRDV